MSEHPFLPYNVASESFQIYGITSEVFTVSHSNVIQVILLKDLCKIKIWNILIIYLANTKYVSDCWM